MSWNYSAYEEEATPSARLTMLRQHITEVQTAISADTSASGRSRSSGSLTTYLDMLHNRRRELEMETGENDSQRAGVATANFRGVRGNR